MKIILYQKYIQSIKYFFNFLKININFYIKEIILKTDNIKKKKYTF